MGADMLISRELGQRSFELLLREIQCVVVDAFASIFESPQEKVDLSKVAR